MKGDYLCFRASYEHEELVEHFFLHTAELEFVQGFRGNVNRNAVAVLLKSLLYLGYFPRASCAHPRVGQDLYRKPAQFALGSHPSVPLAEQHKRPSSITAINL
jgi:hypothetical protein